MGWDYNQVAGLPEPEARKLAIIFEEIAVYQYQKNKEVSRAGSSHTSASQGFEEDFSFGGEDDNDYWDRPDITEGVPIT